MPALMSAKAAVSGLIGHFFRPAAEPELAEIVIDVAEIPKAAVLDLALDDIAVAVDHARQAARDARELRFLFSQRAVHRAAHVLIQ